MAGTDHHVRQEPGLHGEVDVRPDLRGGPAAPAEASRRAAIGYLFVAPFLVVFVAMLVVPLVYAGYLSLFREQLIGGTTFAGLDNYTPRS